MAACSPQDTAFVGSIGARRLGVPSGTAPGGQSSASALPGAPKGAPGTIAGLVLGLDGKPAAGVAISVFLPGSGLVANNGSNLVGNNSAAYRVASLATATTDASGDFSIPDTTGQALDVEAVSSPQVQAFAATVAAGSATTMQLAPTGSISGRVTAPSDPQVTNFLGIDVFVPGSSFQAVTDASGDYTIADVPVGTFSLAALKTGLGQAEVQGVAVRSNSTTQAPDLAMSVAAPILASVSPADAGAGSTVTLSGSNFGASTGAVFQVTYGGAVITQATRSSDTSMQVQVPAGAVSGDFAVTVSGIPSNTLPFSVIASLSISPRTAFFPVGGTQSYSVVALDPSGAILASPSVVWTSTGSAIAFSNGELTAIAGGTGSISVSSGQLTDVLPITVTSLPIVSTLTSTASGFADGSLAQARFDQPQGIVADATGDLFVADFSNNRIREITPGGIVSTYAGSGATGWTNGSATSASFDGPSCLAIDSSGDLYVVDWNNEDKNEIREITPGGIVSTLPVSPSYFSGLAVGPTGTLYVSDGSEILSVSPPGGAGSVLAGGSTYAIADGTGAQAQFANPGAMAVDGSGNLFVADQYPNLGGALLREVSLSAVVSTVAGSQAAGETPGNGTAATLDKVVGMALGKSGLLYFADGDGANYPVEIRSYDPQTGMVATVAGGAALSQILDGAGSGAAFGSIAGMARTPDGTLYVTDGNSIREIRGLP